MIATVIFTSLGIILGYLVGFVRGVSAGVLGERQRMTNQHGWNEEWKE